MLHTLIVPGVGGSEYEHWQSWLERQLASSTRVEQRDWQAPILSEWVTQCANTLAAAPAAVQIVAHSFGCLTSVATLAQHPTLAHKVKKLILVAPANPKRFSVTGFSGSSHDDLADYFAQLTPSVPTEMLISENDPWLKHADAMALAQAWQVPVRNMGQVGHINVASGFGPFPQVLEHLLQAPCSSFITNSDNKKLYFKFAF